MTIETGLLFGAIACILGVAGFFGGRMSAAKNDGEWKGHLDTNLQYIQNDLKEIKADMKANKSTTEESLERLRKEFKDSVRRVHDRLDDHLRDQHNLEVPKRHD